MNYTLAEYAQAIWEYSARTEHTGTAPDPDGSYIDSINRAVWQYANRTETGGGSQSDLVIDNFQFSGIDIPAVPLGQIYNLSIGEFVFEPLQIGTVGIMLDQDEFVFSPLIIDEVILTEEHFMATTQASSGRVYRLTAAADAIIGRTKVKKIRWVGATTIGHVLEIRTGAAGANDVIFHDVAQIVNHTIETDFGEGIMLEGLTVQTLGSGTVYVYYV